MVKDQKRIKRTVDYKNDALTFFLVKITDSSFKVDN